MIYNCLNCSTAIQGQRRKYCSDKCSDEYHLKKSREAYQSVIPKGSYRKSEVCRFLKCSEEILAAVIKMFKISLDKTSTGKSEYVTQENFNLIKQRIEEYNSLPKIKKIIKKTGNISATQIANEIGVSWHLVNKIIKKYNIKETNSDKRSSYYDESAVELVKEKIKEHYNEKENYLDKMQIAVLFGYNPKDLESASACFKRIKQKWGVPPCEPRYIKSGVDKFSSRISYPKKTTLKWIEQLKYTDEWKRRPPGSATLSEEEKQRRLEQKLKEEKEFRQQIKGLIDKKEAIALLGYKSYHTLSNNLDKLPNTRKIKNKYYYKPSEIIKLKKYLEQQKEKTKNKRQQRRPKLNKDWTTDDVYEERLWKRIQKGIPKNVTNQNHIDAWNSNIRLMEDGRLGIIKTFTCTNTCGEELPYTSFYFDVKYGNSSGRRGSCKKCDKARLSSKERTKKPKTGKTLTTRYATSIKQHLANQNGAYDSISTQEVWENLEKYCGYTREDFIAYVESKFEPWMTWDNNGRPTDPNIRTWQLDHIVPKSIFKYTTMADPEFKQCWALSNLKPLESRMNLLKSNKTLMETTSSSFRSGLRKKECKTGVWKHLPYTPKEARAYLEKQWGGPIDWANLKVNGLEIDHIIPQSYLAFETYNDKNFRECWALENLQILSKNDNILKGSVYEDILWVHNYV